MQEKEKSDTTTDQEMQLEILSKELESISGIKHCSATSADNASLSRMPRNSRFFVSAAAGEKRTGYDSYFLHSQLLATYSDPASMHAVKELASFLQDSLASDMENFELSFSLEFLNKSRGPQLETEQREMDISVCRLKESRLVCTQTGKTAFVLLRWLLPNSPSIVFRSDKEPLEVNGGVSYEAEAKDGDLIIMGVNINLEGASDEELIEIVGKHVRRKKCSVSGVARGVLEEVKKKGLVEREGMVTIIASWVAYRI